LIFNFARQLSHHFGPSRLGSSFGFDHWRVAVSPLVKRANHCTTSGGGASLALPTGRRPRLQMISACRVGENVP